MDVEERREAHDRYFGAVARDSVRCPECGSDDVSPFGRDDGKTWPVPVEWLCNHCEHGWEEDS